MMNNSVGFNWFWLVSQIQLYALTQNQVRICTDDINELEYCNFMKEGLISITHDITCHELNSPTKDVYECIEYASNNMGSVAIISPNELTTAYRSDLTVLVSSDHQTKFVIIVNPLKVRNFSDLRGTKGCFTQALGAGELMLAQQLNPFCKAEPCESDVLISNILAGACYPGCRDKPWIKTRDVVDCEKMCQLCESTPDASTGDTCLNNVTENYYAGTAGTVRCLVNRGDFAIIQIDDEAYLPEGMNVMCPNGTLVDSLQVDSGCLLGQLPKNMFVASRQESHLKEIMEVLIKALPTRGFHRVYKSEHRMVMKDAAHVIERTSSGSKLNSSLLYLLAYHFNALSFFILS